MFAFRERAREPGGAAPKPSGEVRPQRPRARPTGALTLRRRFVMEDKPVATDQIVAAVLKDAIARTQLQNALGDRFPVTDDRARYVVKKLQEGVDLPYKAPGDVAVAAAAARKRDPAFFTAGQQGAVGRRLNRLRGQLAECATRLGARKDKSELLTAAIQAANTVVEQLATETAPDVAKLRTTMDDAVKAATVLVPRDKTSAWSAFEVYSRFGPVSYQLGLPALADTPVPAHTALLTSIRAYRHATLATVDNIGVVAHRGTGPTNRTMGKLIKDEDQRRLNRPAENSQEAFEVALGQRSTSTEARLDGVECDVYLSSDGFVIVTHEHDVVEQLPKATRASWKGSRLVERLKASDIKALERKTGVAKSKFILLDELIQLVAPVAAEYFEATGRPFRLEIEMKGTAVKYEKEISREAKAKIGGEPGQLLTRIVAKTVSQAKKATPGLPIEFVLFNGERPDIDRFSKLRQAKTALGDVTTAINYKDYHGALDDPADRLALDEVRFGLASIIGPRNTSVLDAIAALLGSYLATGVFAQEFAPVSLDALRSREPSTELEGDTFQSVSKQAGRRRQGGQVDDEQHFAALCEYLRQGKLPVQRFRMLTDYPEKAAFLKAEVRKALQPVTMPSVQPVQQTGPVPTTTAPVQQPQPRMNAATRPVIDTGSSAPRHERMSASTARPDTTRQPAQAEQPRLGQSTATPTIAQDPPKNLWAGVVTGAVKPSATMAMPTTGDQPGARQPVITNNGPGRGTADRGGSGTGTQGGGYNRGATGGSGTGRQNQKYKGKTTYYSKK